MPFESVEEVMLTVEELHVSEPRVVAPDKSVTVAPDSQEIVKVGVVFLVISSVELVPVSLPLVRSGVPGAAGGVVSGV